MSVSKLRAALAIVAALGLSACEQMPTAGQSSFDWNSAVGGGNGNATQASPGSQSNPAAGNGTPQAGESSVNNSDTGHTASGGTAPSSTGGHTQNAPGAPASAPSGPANNAGVGPARS